MTTESLHRLSDRELLEVTVRVAADERRSTVELVELLSEVDARRLYLGQGCSSLFTYCTEVLRLSESAAYHRIEAARAIRVFPLIVEWLRDGSLTLTNVALLRSHLTLRNHAQLLGEARNKSKREVERQIALLAPKPEVAALVRRLPDTGVAAPAAVVPSVLAQRPGDRGAAIESLNQLGERGIATEVPEAFVASMAMTAPPSLSISRGPQSRVEALASNRYLLRLSLSATGHENLRRAQGLMRHSLPGGDLAAVVERALELLVEHLERRKFAATARPRAPASKPRPTSRLDWRPAPRPTSPSKSRSQSRPTSPSPSPPLPPPLPPSPPLPPGKASASRHLPATVRRAVWRRDRGQCAFVGPNGRCTETGRLEFHHIVPFARGGSASTSNISLRCRAHNAYEGELCFGSRG